jgi:hypothetical protein
MTRISAIVLIAAVTLAYAPRMSFARSSSSPRGTNSAGAAQSGGNAANRKQGNGSGLGTGHAKEPATPGAEAVINQENAVLDRKLKSICRGC